MLEKIIDKSANVAVIDNSAATRQQLSEMLKSFGFSQIRGMATIKDLIEFLETDTVDLVISSIEAQNGAHNAISLLRLISQEPDMKNIRLCLMIGEDDFDYLPAAFELGLLAWFSKPFTKDSLKQAFGGFVANVESAKGKESLVAASYLRPILKRFAKYPLWIDLEKRLLSLHPGSTELLINLAEPLLLSGKKSEAVNVLNQAVLIDPKNTERANAVFSAHAAPGETLQTAKGSDGAFNALGLDKIVVVDPDEAIQKALLEVFKEMGAKTVECFNDGESAATWIRENPDPQLVIQEWRIPKLSGPLFVQRIGAEGAANTPVIVLSSLVQAKDMPLVREMGICNIIEKPFERSEFMRSLVWTMQQERMPTDQGAMEIKIRRLFKARKIEEAEQLMARFLENPAIPQSRKLLMQAECDYTNKRYDSCKMRCVQAMKSNADSVIALNLLGKSLMQLRDFGAALKCLDKAQSLSPQNVERLCNIAEAESELEKQQDAQESIDAASDLDKNAVVVRETTVKVAMNAGQIEKAKKVMANLESMQNIISHLNNKAVALARNDRFDESLQEYEKTVQALPENRASLKSLVYYNMALALVRASRLEDALQKLALALENPYEKIKAKASSLKTRLEQSVGSGRGFQMMGDQDTPPPPPSSADAQTPPAESDTPEFVVSEILPNPGDIGCYMIFTYPDHDEKSKVLLKHKLAFTSRIGISRDETMKIKAGA